MEFLLGLSSAVVVSTAWVFYPTPDFSPLALSCARLAALWNFVVPLTMDDDTNGARIRIHMTHNTQGRQSALYWLTVALQGFKIQSLSLKIIRSFHNTTVPLSFSIIHYFYCPELIALMSRSRGVSCSYLNFHIVSRRGSQMNYGSIAFIATTTFWCARKGIARDFRFRSCFHSYTRLIPRKWRSYHQIWLYYTSQL